MNAANYIVDIDESNAQTLLIRSLKSDQSLWIFGPIGVPLASS